MSAALKQFVAANGRQLRFGMFLREITKLRGLLQND
jgi:hypothetical protein